MANKHQEEEQNAIDKLNENLGTASDKIAQNKKILFWIAGAVLIVGAFVIGYLFIYLNPRLNKSAEAFNAVEITAQGNDSIAEAEYMKVAKNFDGVPMGELAALNAAEEYYAAGKYKEAAQALEGVKVSEPVLAANALCLAGDCYVNLKDYKKALSYFAKAVSKADNNPQIVPRVLLKEANVYDEQKQYGKALECYMRIKEDYPSFSLGNGVSIDAYIAREQSRLGK